MHRWNELDGLRALAILGVIVLYLRSENIAPSNIVHLTGHSGLKFLLLSLYSACFTFERLGSVARLACETGALNDDDYLFGDSERGLHQ
jgi:hypothetical protein